MLRQSGSGGRAVFLSIGPAEHCCSDVLSRVGPHREANEVFVIQTNMPYSLYSDRGHKFSEPGSLVQ